MSMTRRDAVKIGMMAATATGAMAVAGVAGVGAIDSAPAAVPADHQETYRGRRIRVTHAGDAFIDERRLHVMKVAEGAYLSALCHYEFVDTPLVAARRAVDELRGANLLPTRHHA